jgi:hypothetical protein
MSSLETVPALLSALTGAGVEMALNTTGDGLTLTGKGTPPAALLAAVQALKPALLERLSHIGDGAPLAAPASFPEAGCCGQCAQWTPAPAWGPVLGHCAAGRRAHQWNDGHPDQLVLTQIRLRCLAWAGAGYRPRKGNDPNSFLLARD